MSKMRKIKHKGVKLLETRHPPPKKNSDDEDEEEKLLQCIMCNCMTIEEYLKRHIRYNHLISKEDIIDKLYNLHYPTQSVSVSTQTSVIWVDDSEPRSNSKDDPDKGKKISPKFRNYEPESDDDRFKPHPGGGDDEEEVLCPACGDVEDGTPMIACDVCDRWYHWVCVGLHNKPPKGQEWMCTECSSKKPSRKSVNSVRFPGGRDDPGPSGMKPKFKRNLQNDEDDIKVTAVVKPKRGKPNEESETSPRERVTQRRLSGRSKSESPRKNHFEHSKWENGSPPSRKRHSSSDQDEPRNTKASAKRYEHTSSSRKDGYDSHRKKSKKSRHDSDSESNEDDNGDLRASDDSMGDRDFEPRESEYDEDDMNLRDSNKDRREAQHKLKKNKKKFIRNTEDIEEMSRDDMRELCHKELINASGSRDELRQRLRRHFRKKKEAQANKKNSAKKFKLTEITEGDGICKICGLGWNLSDDLELGPLYKYGVCQAHLHCLMFSSGLIQGGDEKEGIVGFMPDDVLREWQRGAKLKCTFCKEIYATVGCCQRTCMKTYHLPCGIKYGALNEYYGNFDSYCPLHRSKRTPKNRPKNYVLTDLGLVPEHVDMEAGFDSEKYKAMMRKLEVETSERRKSTEKKESIKPTKENEYDEPPYKKERKESKGSKKRTDYSDGELSRREEIRSSKKREKSADSSEEEEEMLKKRPGPKSKTMVKKKKMVEEFETEPQAESSEEDIPLSKIKKVKPTSIKKSRFSEVKTSPNKQIKLTIRGMQSEVKTTVPESTRKREPRKVKKSTFGSDIYRSAQDELKRLLEKKHLINIDDTFVNLAGTRRQRAARTTSNADDEDDEEDSYGRSHSRTGRKCVKRAVVEVDDEEDYGTPKESFNKKSQSRDLGTPISSGKGESIESIEKFLGDEETGRNKSEKRKKRNSGPDSADELIESDEDHRKEDSPDNEENSKSIPTPNLSENEFEDTEQDSGHENLDQNDGFTDCADLSNVTSDEGTDADIKKQSEKTATLSKAMFNDDEAEEQLDLSGLIRTLEKDEDKKAINMEPISRYKCPFCAHSGKSKKRIEQHISYAHNRKNMSKNLASKQEMMIYLDKNVDKDATQIDSTQNADGAKKDVATDTENGKKNKSNKKIPEEPTLDDDQGSKRARRRTVKGEEFEALTKNGKRNGKKNDYNKEKEGNQEKEPEISKQMNEPETPKRKSKRQEQQNEIKQSNEEQGEGTQQFCRTRRKSPVKEAIEKQDEKQNNVDNPSEKGASESPRSKKVNLKNYTKDNQDQEVKNHFEEPSQSDVVSIPIKKKYGKKYKNDEEKSQETKKVSQETNNEGANHEPDSSQTVQNDRNIRSTRKSGRMQNVEEKKDEEKNSPVQTPRATRKQNKMESSLKDKDYIKDKQNNIDESNKPTSCVTSTRKTRNGKTESNAECKIEETISGPLVEKVLNKTSKRCKREDHTELEDNKKTGASRRSGTLSPSGSISDSMFECLKCGTKIMQTRELVLNHLKRHKLTLEKYIDTFAGEQNLDKISTITEWKNDTSLSGIKVDSKPERRSSRRGGNPLTNVNDTHVADDKEKEEISEKDIIPVKEEKKTAPFKLLFSTVGDYTDEKKDDKSDVGKIEQSITEVECSYEKDVTEADEDTVSQQVSDPLDIGQENVEPDSTTTADEADVDESPRLKKVADTIAGELLMKYTDENGCEVKWVQGSGSEEMPDLLVAGKLSGKVDLAEIEHALDQDVQIPERFRKMLPLIEDKDEDKGRIVLRIKKVKT